MQKILLGAAAAVLSLTVVGTATESFAQAQSDVMMPVPAKRTHGRAARDDAKYGRYRPLTVAKPRIGPTPAVAAASPMASPLGIVTGPIGFAGQIATAPLSGLSQAFGYGAIGGASKPLPIVARYENAGPVTDSVNQGWAQPVPLTANGPVYKLEPVANNGGVSPFTVIAAPITAATTLATAPFNAVGSVVGAPPPPAPVF